MKKKKYLKWWIAAVSAVFIVGAGIFVYTQYKAAQTSGDVATKDGTSASASDITWNGKTYSYNEHLSNFLFLGIDTKEKAETKTGQADAGQADWALDPIEVCLRYAHSFQGGHLNATSESFALSEVYSSAPYSGNEEAAEDLIVLLDNDAGRLEATLDYNSGGIWQADALSVSTSALSV